MSKDWIVVIGSIWNINPDYLGSIPENIPVLVVDDSNGNITKNRKNMIVINYKNQEDYLGEYVDLIPRKSPSCKNFGLIYAFKEGYKRVIGLDDDCDTCVSPQFMSEIDIIGEIVELPYCTSENGWFNPCSMLRHGQMYSRGYPYELRGFREKYQFEDRKKKVIFNAGLWTGSPDINGIDKLSREIPYENELKEPKSLGIEKGTVFPLSIGNYQILAECIPAFFQAPDFDMPSGFKIRRHDDIWSALILKYLADKREEGVTVGKPIVNHMRKGNPVREILSEFSTILIQRDFCRLVEEATRDIEKSSYLEMYHKTALNILNIAKKSSFGVYDRVFLILAKKMLRWVELFSCA